MSDKKKLTGALALLTPNAIKTNVDGREVVVASNKDENDALNMIMISMGRTLIQEALKRWKEDEQTPSPKELKDIITSMKELAESSKAIYEGSEPLDGKGKAEKPAEKTGNDSIDTISFESITKTPEVDKNDDPADKGNSQPID